MKKWSISLTIFFFSIFFCTLKYVNMIRISNISFFRFCWKNGKLDWPKCARTVMLQDQSNLRLVKFSTGEFMRKNSYWGHWNGTVGYDSCSLWPPVPPQRSALSFIKNNTLFKRIEGCINTIHVQCYQSVDFPCGLW